MTQDITIEEIVRLNAARTQGEWYTMAGGPRIELGDTGTIYDEGGHTEDDAAFIAAAPRIAAKCLEQHQKLQVIEPGFFTIMEYVQNSYNEGAKWVKAGGNGADTIIARCAELEVENEVLKRVLSNSESEVIRNRDWADKFSTSLTELDKVNKELVEALREIRKIADNSEGILEMVTEALTKAEAL